MASLSLHDLNYVERGVRHQSSSPSSIARQPRSYWTKVFFDLLPSDQGHKDSEIDKSYPSLSLILHILHMVEDIDMIRT